MLSGVLQTAVILLLVSMDTSLVDLKLLGILVKLFNLGKLFNLTYSSPEWR